VCGNDGIVSHTKTGINRCYQSATARGPNLFLVREMVWRTQIMCYVHKYTYSRIYFILRPNSFCAFVRAILPETAHSSYNPEDNHGELQKETVFYTIENADMHYTDAQSLAASRPPTCSSRCTSTGTAACQPRTSIAVKPASSRSSTPLRRHYRAVTALHLRPLFGGVSERLLFCVFRGLTQASKEIHVLSLTGLA
jgi:hypothetical protein